MNKLTAPGLPRRRGGRGSGGWSLRAQFTLVIFLLTFLPNLTVTLPGLMRGAAPTWWPLWMVAVGGVSALTGYVLSGALLRPLHRLETEVVSGEVLGRPLAEPHSDDPAEVRALRGAFAGLLGRLGTEQERRSAFMATLVHDLKTPLIATGHLTRLLTGGGLPETERRGVGEQMLAETERLLTLVGQMADAHRFEREDVQLRRAPTDLRALLEGSAQRLSPRAAERGLSLSVGGQGEATVEATVDAAALERAVTNLTENALRYARHRVQLSVVRGGVEVQDDGPGLASPLADLAQPFNAQPATIAGQQYTAGTAGLGLFIARRIAEAHGGELRYSRTPPDLPDDCSASPAPGAPHLTTFTLCLPEVSP